MAHLINQGTFAFIMHPNWCTPPIYDESLLFIWLKGKGGNQN